MNWLWRVIDYGWWDYLVLVLVGRAVLSCLPPGRVGGSRPSELPATLVVSALLGHAAMSWTFTVGPDLPHEARWWLAAPWLLLGAVRWWTRPHALVAGQPLPVPVDARGRGPATLVVLLAASSPLWWIPLATRDETAGRVVASVGLLVLAVTVLHALGNARRALAGRTLIAVLLVTTPALRESVFHVPTVPAAFVALTCGGLIGWVRRADPRHAALASIGAAASYPYSPTTWIAGFATLLVFSHHQALRRALAWSAGLLLFVIGVEYGLGEGAAARLSHQTDLPILAPSFTEALERRDLWGLVWYACGAAALASLGGVCGGRMKELPLKPGEAERPRREVRAMVLFTALAFGLHAAERWAPESLLPAHARPTWLGFLAMMLPAAGIVLGLVFAPGERVATRESAS